ncbi:MAG: 2-C-methyl-D-erythritol 2,4-cyclodiphosphate synthase [Candidatus Omnitrophica bacterium]|nr:2-C-methyl-D-erythritol 2,4-cyclodiphosphate synthase [bacterium]NUN97120.1 2-C-methyl-D-erythritol 2,4-cyclodiphosphate synthase [Candidatus Omnitrophota bacterium]
MNERLRVGIGYDIHKASPGSSVRLGGVDIPSEIELVGHSDADVVIHALIDALFGAAGLGDIGDHFPPSDEAYRGIDSTLLLERALERVHNRGFDLVNVDTTVIAETPKLGPHKKEMGRRLAELLGLPTQCVNVKATTRERLGSIGRGEGIAAQAVVLLSQRGDG